MGLKDIRTIMENTRPQYLGAHTSGGFGGDPKHLVFTLSRYKFVAKMLEGYGSVLEVGCGDGFGSTIVAQSVQHLVGIDVEPYAIEHPADNAWLRRNTKLLVHDIVAAPFPERFEAVYSLDVIEHIPPAEEDRFLQNIVASTVEGGVLIIGTPNATAAQYASANSQIAHVNLKTYALLKETLRRFCQHVFMFGMNDEVLHTGFGPMCHYLIALGVGLRKS